MVKVYKTIDEQINLLEERKLLIDDRDSAKYLLNIISYYRLTSYRFPFFDKDTETYLEGFSIENLKSYYEIDVLYKSFLYYNLQYIEVAFRTLLINNFSQKDPYFYVKKDNYYFKKSKEADQRKKVFLDKIKKDINNTNNSHIAFYQEKHDKEIKNKLPNKDCNYRKNNCKSSYEKCDCTPEAWVAFESFDFGQLIQVYSKLRKDKFQTEKDKIANFFSLKDINIHYKDLLNMLEDIKRIRNVVVHHDKILDRYSFKDSTSIGFLKKCYSNNPKVLDLLTNKISQYRSTFLPYFLVIKYFLDVLFANNKIFSESEGINLIKYFLVLSSDRAYKGLLSLDELDDSIFKFSNN